MGLIYSFCFGNGQHNRSDEYKVDEEQPPPPPDEPKTYSWDKRKPIDAGKYMFDGLRDQVLYKAPGQIDGQQFIVQNCHGCTITLLDHSATVTVDDCVDCTILIGPCKGSVFVRDCSSCRLMIACQQFRTRDCRDTDIFLLCQTQPIIEASHGMRFGCLQLEYRGFRDHLDAAKLSVFNNNWSKIHDFTPPDSGTNYSYMAEDADPLTLAPIKPPDGIQFPELTCHRDTSSVPLTLGKRSRPSPETCFCLLYSDKEIDLRPFALDLIRYVSSQDGCRLVMTNELAMTSADLVRLTGMPNPIAQPRPPCLAMEWTPGPAAAQLCRQYRPPAAAEETVANSVVPSRYVIDGPQASSQLSQFYNYVEMQHGN